MKGYKSLSKSSPLSAKMRKFVEEYVVDYNAARAAAEAGYKSPKVAGQKLLKHRDVVRALSVRQTYDAKKNELKKQRIIEELALCVLRDPVDLVDEKGLFHSDLRKIPENIRRCIDKFEVEQHVNPRTGKVTQTIKVSLTSKLAAIDMAMRHKGLFAPEESNVNLKVPIDWDSLLRAGAAVMSGKDDPVQRRLDNPTAPPPKKTVEIPKVDYTVSELAEEEESQSHDD